MAQVQQASVSMNGVSSEKNSNGNGITLEDIPLHNGTPMDGYGASSSSAMALEDLVQLSPGSLRRRSTRASALKAQEKIKSKDDIVTNTNPTEPSERDEMELSEEGEFEDEEEVKPKKRKLEHGRDLDQFCHRFGLRATDDGSVYAMTDESENSSIHSSEMEIVRVHYEKMLSKEMTAEQLHERIMMKKEAEKQLRIEEAKLATLKKMKHSQTIAIQKMTDAKKLTANIPNMNSTAYKPIIAPPLNKGTSSNSTISSTAATNGKQSESSKSNPKNAALLALAGLTPQQQQEFLTRVQSSSAAQAFLQAKKNGSNLAINQNFVQMINQAQEFIKMKAKESVNPSTPTQSAPTATATVTATPLVIPPTIQQSSSSNNLTSGQARMMSSQTPQQRISAARMAFRAQADKQLMGVSAPKAPPPDIFFIPNPSQPAFTYLLGLDLAVQRVMKDKSWEKKYTDKPYECEECHTDFTPSWKAIGSSPDDLHLYCEQCVRQAQKRKIRLDHSNFLKKAYQKISTQEKEFEKKIAEGTLEQAFEQSRPVAQTPTAPSTSSSATPAMSRLTANASASGSGTSTPTAAKSATPVPTPKSQSSSSSAKKMQNQANMQMQQMLFQQCMQNPVMRNPAMMQMMTMYMSQQAQQAARMNMPQMPNMNQMLAMMMAQQQQQQQQQQQAASQAAATAAANNAQQQQINQLAALMASSTPGNINPQLARMIQGMNGPQQKQLFELMRKK